ncbi:hypothetical protein OU798_10975 [Prolixibacteraceae bacterium Z1-6]|uniref:Type IX secretion system membrane protein PorP/SprF n=1 Tax=Draconibacterium aestuarii TaxID=2998507 RepID=A0A9X3J7N2_9BACT|nr:hypothetical protein [Prolixibacteraceae bacterium Z1-6]
MGKAKVKYLISIFFSVFVLCANAQQKLMPEFGEIDSTELAAHRQLEYYQFITGDFGNDQLLDEIELPKFNTQQEYSQRYTAYVEFLPLNDLVFAGLSSGEPFGAHSPFYHNGTILSQQAYQLGDKLVIGGYSYGMNSIYTAPFPNQNSSYFDTYGSTMFMQYKVSKNFKIETRVSVGQNRSVGF